MVPAHSKGSADMESGIILIFLLGIASGFEVYWNVPTGQCSGYKLGFEQLLKSYGVLVNDGDTFKGNRITIFYESELGLYPKIDHKSGEHINGGIPQRADLEKHLTQARIDLKKIIPSENFNGLGVIDWEAWRPTWKFMDHTVNLTVYQNETYKFIRETNPNASDSEIKRIAESQWTNITKAFMLKSLRLAKELRPHALWCYYGFPACYNYKGNKSKDFKCNPTTMAEHDKLAWMWEESTAVCPTIYVYPQHFDEYTFEQRTWKDNENLRESMRVAKSNAKVYPYINYHAKRLIPEEEMWRLLAQPAAVGTNGVVIWGASASVDTEKGCRDLKQYIIDTLGPAAQKVADRSDLCSQQICNGQGRCTFPGDDNAYAWILFADDSGKFIAEDITCRCNENYNGRYCENKK